MFCFLIHTHIWELPMSMWNLQTIFNIASHHITSNHSSELHHVISLSRTQLLRIAVWTWCTFEVCSLLPLQNIVYWAGNGGNQLESTVRLALASKQVRDGKTHLYKMFSEIEDISGVLIQSRRLLTSALSQMVDLWIAWLCACPNLTPKQKSSLLSAWRRPLCCKTKSRLPQVIDLWCRHLDLVNIMPPFIAVIQLQVALEG